MTRFMKPEEMTMAELTEEISRLGPKIDSGRHTGADVQRLRRCLKVYFEREKI